MGNVEVVCTTAQNINLAFYQNAIPIIRELSIRNASGDELRQIAVRLSSEPPFVTPGVWRIDRIANEDVHHLTVVDLKLDHAFLAGLTASRRAEIFVRIEFSDRRSPKPAWRSTSCPLPTGAVRPPRPNSSPPSSARPIRASTLSCAKPPTSSRTPDAAQRSTATPPERRPAPGKSPRPSGPPSSAIPSLTSSLRKASSARARWCALPPTFSPSRSAPASI